MLRTAAANVLLTLPAHNEYYEHTARIRCDVDYITIGYKLFNPAFVRADALCQLADKVPDEARRTMCERTLQLVRYPLQLDDNYGLLQINAVTKVAEVAVKHNDSTLFKGAYETLEYLRQKFPKKPYGSYHEREWNRLQQHTQRAASYMQLVKAVQEGEEGLLQLVTRMERDTEAKRGYFSLAGLIQAMQLLNEVVPSPVASIANPSLIERLGDSIVDRYIQSVGSDTQKRLFTERWPSLVKAIHGLSVDDVIKDRIMTRLIERGTPRSTLDATSEQSSYELGLVYDGFKALDFVLNDQALPHAEAALLKRLGTQVNEMQFSRLDARVKGAISGLGWMYKRLADSSTVDPTNVEELSGLRAGEQYQHLLKQLFVFTVTQEPRRSLEETVQCYQDALDSRSFDALDQVSQDLHHHLLATTNLVYDNILKGPEVGRGGTRQYVTRDDLEGTLYGTLRNQLSKAYAEKDYEQARSLIKLLTQGSELDETMVKVDMYAEYLASPDVPIDDKRALFAELSRTKYISRYAKALTGDLREKGDIEREQLAYNLALPWHGGHNLIQQADTLLAMVEDYDIEAVRKLNETYARFRRSGGNEFKVDPTDHFAREIFAHYFHSTNQDTWPRMMVQTAETLWILRDGMPDELTTFKQGHYKSYQNYRWERHYHEVEAVLGKHYHDDYGHHHFDYFGHLRYAELLSRTPTKAEIDRSLVEIKECFDRRFRLEDRVKGRLVEVPDIFKDQPPLVQFLASRYMMQLTAGEQQDLLLSMENVPKGEALLRFFEKAHLEKIGQFLSVWPQVPKDIRQELSRLQSNVSPSSREEAIKTIQDNVGDGIVARHLIDNLSAEPIGSGTIGDVFRSQLPDGRDVAVKIITPSKEENFRKGLHIMKKVRDLLEIYGDEIEGSAEVVRFVDMYVEMVEQELNLMNELRNYREFKDLYGGQFRMAEHYESLSSAKVLVMEYLPTLVPITDPRLRQPVAAELVSRLKAHLLFLQVVNSGLALTDLQPGNVAVALGDVGRVCLLDFGQVVRLDQSDRDTILRFVVAAGARNFDELLQVIEGASEQTAKYDEGRKAQLRASIESLLNDSDSTPNDASELLSRMLRYASDAGLLVRPQILQIVKGLATIEGTENALKNVGNRP